MKGSTGTETKVKAELEKGKMKETIDCVPMANIHCLKRSAECHVPLSHVAMLHKQDLDYG